MNGFIVYQGASQLDGAPIVCIATGLTRGDNPKTGAMVQTWILRADQSPVEAIATGGDAAVCGDCPHRGLNGAARSCYVIVHQGPTAVYRAFLRGSYPLLSPAQASAAVAGGKVRLGAYGDPAAVPLEAWTSLLRDVQACTGYTHQWRALEAQPLKQWCMASCDSPEDYVAAQRLGWRTFRVRSAGEPRMAREVICPASREAGHKTTCSACLACGGHSSRARADITILAHGTAGKVRAFDNRREH